MGYYTRHELEVTNGDNSLIEKLREYSDEANFSLYSNGDTQEESKWYGHQDELKKFSKLHPNALFILSGEGEEAGDIWREYYKNGKVQMCKAKISFDDFDEKLLK